MSDNRFNKQLLINTLWSSMGRFGFIIIGLISNIILVRLLTPAQFGQVSIAMFFVVIFSILVESGLSGALVRKQSVSKEDYSTVFIFNLVVSVSLILLMLVSAPAIASYYNDDTLINLLRFSSLLLFVNALKITQTVKLIRSLEFKKKSFYEIVSIFIGSIIAIFSAMNGAGAYAIVILQIASSLILTIVLWNSVGWIGSYKFSRTSFRQVYSFGINTTLASLIDKAFDSSYQLILAKYFSISQSGYFYQAKKLQEMPISVIQGSILGVVYATLSKLQDNRLEFNKLYYNIVRIFSILVALICLIIFIYSDSIIVILYGENWLESSVYLKVLIIASFFYLQEIFNRIIFKIFNKTKLILILEVVKKSVLSLTIIFGIWSSSIPNLLYGFLITSIVSFFINYHIAKKIHKQSYWQELNIIFKVFLSSLCTVLISFYLIHTLSLNSIFSLILLPLIIGIYSIILILLNVINPKNDFRTLKKLIK